LTPAIPSRILRHDNKFGEESMQRRDFLRLTGATLAAGFSMKALAQAWPDKPIKLIVPYAPGGATDTIARPWADKLSQAFGQQFVIENRGGALRA
jgi:tripartite-type tricarboxylate transporter receptor subunit TctC